MNALTLLALLQEAQATPQQGLQSYGWSPILWFWVILGAIMVVLFFALAFRKPTWADGEEERREHERLGREDREVYP